MKKIIKLTDVQSKFFIDRFIDEYPFVSDSSFLSSLDNYALIRVSAEGFLLPIRYYKKEHYSCAAYYNALKAKCSKICVLSCNGDISFVQSIADSVSLHIFGTLFAPSFGRFCLTI